MNEKRIMIREAARTVDLSEQAVRKWVDNEKISTASIPYEYGGTTIGVLLSEVQAQKRRTKRLWFGILPEVYDRLREIADIEKMSLPSAVEFIINRTWAAWYAEEENDAAD